MGKYKPDGDKFNVLAGDFAEAKNNFFLIHVLSDEKREELKRRAEAHATKEGVKIRPEQWTETEVITREQIKKARDACEPQEDATFSQDKGKDYLGYLEIYKILNQTFIGGKGKDEAIIMAPAANISITKSDDEKEKNENVHIVTDTTTGKKTKLIGYEIIRVVDQLQRAGVKPADEKATNQLPDSGKPRSK